MADNVDLSLLRRRLEEIEANTQAGVTLPGGGGDGTSGGVSDHVTHRELDNALAAAEARTETRFVQLDANIKALTASLSDKGGLLDQVGELRTEVRSEARTTRRTVAGVFIATILAALAAPWTTQANLLSAFQAALALHH